MPGLQSQASDLAATLGRVLNATVCNGVRLGVAVDKTRAGHIIVGNGLSKAYVVTPQPIPIRLRNGSPHGWLDLQYRLCMDESGEYLMVRSSFVAVMAPDDARSVLCHFDYERDKADGYPEAHLQVDAESGALTAWNRPRGAGDRRLAKLHFPTGARRYRPTLEDVVEFLVAEKLASGRRGWKAVVDDGRAGFQRKQLRAAIRADPDTAREMLAEMGRTAPDAR
jgi:hypothetical protein